MRSTSNQGPSTSLASWLGKVIWRKPRLLWGLAGDTGSALGQGSCQGSSWTVPCTGSRFPPQEGSCGRCLLPPACDTPRGRLYPSPNILNSCSPQPRLPCAGSHSFWKYPECDGHVNTLVPGYWASGWGNLAGLPFYARTLFIHTCAVCPHAAWSPGKGMAVLDCPPPPPR